MIVPGALISYRMRRGLAQRQKWCYIRTKSAALAAGKNDRWRVVIGAASWNLPALLCKNILSNP